MISTFTVGLIASYLAHIHGFTQLACLAASGQEAEAFVTSATNDAGHIPCIPM